MSKMDEAQQIGSWRPHLLKGWLVEILQRFFEDPDNIWDSTVSSYTWSSDEKNTDLIITTRYHLDLDNPGVSAKLIIRTGDTQIKVPIQNAGLAQLDWQTGERRNEVVALTQFTISLVGRTEAFVEKLRDEVGLMFTMYNKVFRERFDIKEIFVRGMSAVEQQKDEVYMANVSLTISVGHGSVINLNDLPAGEFGKTVP